MAYFRNEPDEWRRLDYQILREGSSYLYYKDEVLGEAIAWLSKEAYKLFEFDAGTWHSEEFMHQDFASRLSFPDYYGRNLDALKDCMTDIEIALNGGTALVFRRYDAFNGKFPQTAQTVLDIFDEISRSRMVSGERLIALVQSNDPTIGFDQIGRYSARWNSNEWLDSSRGL